MPKKAEPLGGDKAIAKALEKGKDPNADMEVTVNGERLSQVEAGVNMRIRGASWSQIARTLDFAGPYAARTAIERALASGAEDPEGRAAALNLTERRLTRLLNSVMGKALDPNDPEHLAYNARALAIVDRHAKLRGLDAPTRVQVSPSDERIHEMVQHFAELANMQQQAIEADIIEADTQEDG